MKTVYAVYVSGNPQWWGLFSSEKKAKKAVRKWGLQDYTCYRVFVDYRLDTAPSVPDPNYNAAAESDEYENY